MLRFYVSSLDSETFIVADVATNTEFCICNEFESSPIPAKERAEIIAGLLNRADTERLRQDVATDS